MSKQPKQPEVASKNALDYGWLILQGVSCIVPTFTPLDLRKVDPADFDIRTFDDEIRVDEQCNRLLLAVRDQLLTEPGCTPLKAGELCQGADYFLREFIIAECADNLFDLPPERVRQFAGHWYIVRNLEPNIEELTRILTGVAACYRVLAEHHLVDQERAEAISILCDNLPWYRQRIDDFWAIEGDGYASWQDACPLTALRP